MSAEIMRQAAALMRKRAEAAQFFAADQGREWWSSDALVDAFTAYTGEEPGVVIWGVDKDAVHIASWHPAVALAVADWLDSVARVDLDRSQRETHAACDQDCDVVRALAVARAYLGESK